MSLVCTTVTSWVSQTVLSPVNTWIHHQQVECDRLHWWDPRSWFCWLITISVLIVVWVTQYIVVPITETVCTVTTSIPGYILLPFAAAIDAVCNRCHASDWIKHWLITPARIIPIGRVPSTTRPNYYVYTFVCNCSLSRRPTITVEAASDEEAAALAITKCGTACA